MHERVAKLEVEMEQVKATLEPMRKDVRETRDAVVGAKWAGRVVIVVVGALGTLVGWLSKGASAS